MMNFTFWKKPDTMTSYLLSVMALSRDDRYNISKDFNYFDGFEGKHFKDHVKAIEADVKYHWLIYKLEDDISNDIESKWNEYLEHVQDKANDKNKIKKQITSNLEYRVLKVKTKYQQIRWRITIYGDKVVLSTYEPEINSYGKDRTTVTFPNAAQELQVAFKQIWDKCTID